VDVAETKGRKVCLESTVVLVGMASSVSKVEWLGLMVTFPRTRQLAFFSFQRLHGFRQVVTHVQSQQKDEL